VEKKRQKETITISIANVSLYLVQPFHILFQNPEIKEQKILAHKGNRTLLKKITQLGYY
jgi:hypothetical protein